MYLLAAPVVDALSRVDDSVQMWTTNDIRLDVRKRQVGGEPVVRSISEQCLGDTIILRLQVSTSGTS